MGRPALADRPRGALYFRHQWPAAGAARARDPFGVIADHVLLGLAGDLDAVDRELALAAGEAIAGIVAAVPDDLLIDAPAGITPPFASPDENRAAYLEHFPARLAGPRPFVAALNAARGRSAEAPAIRREYRR